MNIMKKLLIGLFLVLFMLMACAVASILLARGFFTLRTTSDAPSTVDVAPEPANELPDAPALESLMTPTLAAPPALGAPGDAAGFNGSFSGTLTADNGSTAPATLVLSQTGEAVSGRLSIGDGLSVDAGNCGVVAVPGGEQNASGSVDPANPNRLATSNSIPVSGLTIGVALAADLAADGNSITTRIDLDLPFLCGRDATISGTFLK